MCAGCGCHVRWALVGGGRCTRPLELLELAQFVVVVHQLPVLVYFVRLVFELSVLIYLVSLVFELSMIVSLVSLVFELSVLTSLDFSFVSSFPLCLFGSWSLVLEGVGIVSVPELVDVGFRGWRFWVWVAVIVLGVVRVLIVIPVPVVTIATIVLVFILPFLITGHVRWVVFVVR